MGTAAFDIIPAKQDVNTGNASNPSPGPEPDANRQLLPEEAEKYIREAGNIEDLPDANDQKDMDETIQKQADS